MHRSLVFLDRSILILIFMMMSKSIDCDNVDEDENRGGALRGSLQAYRLHYWRRGLADWKEYRDSLGRTVSQAFLFVMTRASSKPSQLKFLFFTQTTPYFSTAAGDPWQRGHVQHRGLVALPADRGLRPQTAAPLQPQQDGLPEVIFVFVVIVRNFFMKNVSK